MRFVLRFGAAVLVWLVSPASYPLDLMQSYRLALQQDVGYQAALATTSASREAIPQTLSQLLPNLTGSINRSKNYTDSAVPGPAGSTVNNSYDYIGASYDLTLRQPLYRKHSFAQYEQAKAQVESAEAALDVDLQDLLARVCIAYFESLMAHDHLALVGAQKEAYGAQLKAAKRWLAAGSGTRTDVDDAQARYDMTLAQELEAGQNMEFTRRQLQVIINQPVENLALLNPALLILASPVPAKMEDWIERGEQLNGELRAMRANVEAAQQEVEKAKAGHYPTVDLVLQRKKTLSQNDTTINQRYLTSRAEVQVNIPLFAGGYANSLVRQALANLDKQRYQYEAKRREIGLRIRKEFQNVTEGVLRVRSLEQAERSADQAVFSNQKGFQAGTRSQIDILNAQQQRMNARRDLAQARYRYILARVRLQGLVNALDEGEIGTINGWLSDRGGDRARRLN